MEPSKERDLYMDCIIKQLQEVDLLSSIYSSPGEMHILDPGVISDFNEFLDTLADKTAPSLKAHLDYTITINVMHKNRKEKLEVRIELPHLYPELENAIVSIHSPLLTKAKEHYFKMEIEQFIAAMEPNETYIFQVISWVQEHIEELINRNNDEFECDSITAPPPPTTTTKVTGEGNTAAEEVKLEDFERLWIYSHHLKAKTKRQEIVKLARELDLSGFSRPGKPGVICVEGLMENTQKFWKIIKTFHWQRIVICKSEVKRKPETECGRLRRFEGFKEQLFCDDLENETTVMDMGLFIKYLELHNSGYMKKELFGLD